MTEKPRASKARGFSFALRATSRAHEYRRREPEHTALYAVLQSEPETFLARAAPDERLPAFIERELRAFLPCGVLRTAPRS